MNTPIPPVNEPVLDYLPHSSEKKDVLEALSHLYNSHTICQPFIGGKYISTNDVRSITPPHNHKKVIGSYHYADESIVQQAIDAALKTQESWAQTPYHQRAAIFERAADLISGPWRARINAATMASQSKSIYQAEIDAACETADFFRFNAYYGYKIQEIQPISTSGINNELLYRPLEGFVYAVTPFNFTAIAANLPCAPALMGNVVVWKPSDNQALSAHITMEILREAGLPDGVINLVYADGAKTSELVMKHPDFAGLHFTGSTSVFHHLWKLASNNVHLYRSFPKLVGETGGKDFIIAHPSAEPKALITAMIRGAFEYQGQKCSAASRAYIPQSIWSSIKETLVSTIEEIQVGNPEDPTCFMNAVIDEKAFLRITSYITKAATSPDAQIIAGGSFSMEQGYFIRPTLLQTTNPQFVTMREELFGPVLTVFVYPDQEYEQTLILVNNTSNYALTGAIFATEEPAILLAKKYLSQAAGNLYINDKPTGAVVGQQPFGGARQSGTNDKSGSMLNLLRWVSPQTIKTNINPPTDYKYPFMNTK